MKTRGEVSRNAVPAKEILPVQCSG